MNGARGQETADGRRWPFGAAEERPPSLGTVAPCKRGAREDRQGRRNDTARVEDDPPGGRDPHPPREEAIGHLSRRPNSFAYGQARGPRGAAAMTDVPQRILGLLQASDRPLSKGKIALDLQLNLRTIEPHLRTLSKE